jgi:hypothetical protein
MCFVLLLSLIIILILFPSVLLDMHAYNVFCFTSISNYYSYSFSFCSAGHACIQYTQLTRVRPLWHPHRYFASPYIVIFTTTFATVWYCSQSSIRYGRILDRIGPQIQPKTA